MKIDGVVEWEGDMVVIVVIKQTNVADESTTLTSPINGPLTPPKPWVWTSSDQTTTHGPKPENGR